VSSSSLAREKKKYVEPFKNLNEMLTALVTGQDRMNEWTKQYSTSEAEEIIRLFVGSNTWRRLKRSNGNKPSVAIRSWAMTEIKPISRLLESMDLGSQKAFDLWNDSFCRNFASYWKRAMHYEIDYAPQRKIPNLLLKRILLLNEVKSETHLKLEKLLHVPLDSFVLRKIRICAPQLAIPSGAFMGYVSSETKYNEIQEWIRDVCKMNNTFPIHLDIYSWDLQHEHL
jgi:hypothetical protein